MYTTNKQKKFFLVLFFAKSLDFLKSYDWRLLSILMDYLSWFSIDSWLRFS